MKIVLREDVDTLGRKGDLIEVADGYARNYLVPRGIAMKATKGVVAQAESMRRSREVKESRDRDSAQAIAFGLLLYGAGSASVDDFSFDVVRNDVPTTGSPQLPAAPRNLDFEQ